MKAYRGVFRKKDGALREMYFARLEDISAINPDYLGDRLTGSGSNNVYPAGMELVWDLEADDGEGDFRIFNHKTKLDLHTFEVEDELFA